MGPLEGGTVIACDRACLRQGPYVHSAYVVAARRDCSGYPSALGCSRLHWQSGKTSREESLPVWLQKLVRRFQAEQLF
jgi:hypothetical protein